MRKFRFKDCNFYIDGVEVIAKSDIINAASELSLGKIPHQLHGLDLDEDDLEDIEFIITDQIFVKGECLDCYDFLR